MHILVVVTASQMKPEQSAFKIGNLLDNTEPKQAHHFPVHILLHDRHLGRRKGSYRSWQTLVNAWDSLTGQPGLLQKFMPVENPVAQK